MAKQSRARSWRTVLRYNSGASRSVIRRAYAAYRQEQGIAKRCDEPTCRFHTEPLEWNGKPLPLILDHVDGVCFDHSPKALRYLCPNCDSQQLTKGGANRGRVQDKTADGHTVVNRDGSKVVAATGRA